MGAHVMAAVNSPSLIASIADYRSAIEEFDHLWATNTTQEQNQRTAFLLNQIESFEAVYSKHDILLTSKSENK